MKSSSINMTEGNILKNLIYFAIPLLIGNIIQQLYMGQPQGVLEDCLKVMEDFAAKIFRTDVKSLHFNGSYPFWDEPSKYVAPGSIDEAFKMREEILNAQCDAAYRFGVEFAVVNG